MCGRNRVRSWKFRSGSGRTSSDVDACASVLFVFVEDSWSRVVVTLSLSRRVSSLREIECKGEFRVRFLC